MKKVFLTGLWATILISCNRAHEQDFYNAGNNAFISENYYTAIDDMNKAIELKPDFANAYFVRANSYNNLGNFTKALGDYTNAIKYDPEYAVAYRLRGIVKITTGDTLNALHDWEAARKLGDSRAGHYLFLYGKFLRKGLPVNEY